MCEDYAKCPRCQQKAYDESITICEACGYCPGPDDADWGEMNKDCPWQTGGQCKAEDSSCEQENCAVFHFVKQINL